MTAEREQRAMNRLRAGAGAYACGGFLAGQSALQRSEICTSLLFDRLERKMRMVEALRHEAAENWNQTFYLLYFRTLGDRQNQEAYLTLARRVSYKTVLRERLAPHAVESLLFGASGLLALYPHDTYTLNLARNFEYLAAKYNIEPMQAGAWQLGDIRPANHPVLRLAQAAEFFAQDEFVMERAMACARKRRSGGSSASRPRITGGRTIFRESQATTGPSVWGLSRPTSSASTSSRCCNSPTAATPDAKPCATAP